MESRQKSPASRRSARVRSLWVALVFAGAACAFVVADRILGGPESEKARPAARTDGPRRDVVREEVDEPDLEDEPRSGVPTFDRTGLPDPPKRYKGTQLEWMINCGHLSAAEFEELLRSIGELGLRDRLAALRYLKLKPDPALAPVLADIADRVPDHVQSLASYSFTCISMLRALVRREHEAMGGPPTFETASSWRDPRTTVFESDVGARLIENTLETESVIVADHGAKLDEQSWTGVMTVLDRLAKLFPGYREKRDYSKVHAEIDASTASELAKALEPRPGYRGGIGAIRFAARYGGSATLDLLLDMLAHRDVVRRKFRQPTREREATLISEVAGAVARRGTLAQRTDLARLILRDLETEKDTLLRTRLWSHARLLATKSEPGSAVLHMLLDAPARNDHERAQLRVIGRIAKGEYWIPGRRRVK